MKRKNKIKHNPDGSECHGKKWYVISVQWHDKKPRYLTCYMSIDTDVEIAKTFISERDADDFLRVCTRNNAPVSGLYVMKNSEFWGRAKVILITA